MRKQTVLMLLVSIITSGAVSLFVQKPNFITALWAATGTKAVVFVIGADCPPGMQTASAAGFPEMQNNRFPLLVADTNANTSGDAQVDNVSGGNSVIGPTQMPSHTHYYTSVSGVTGGGWGLTGSSSWGGVVAVGFEGRNSGSAGGTDGYWPRYYKLKPCIWTVN